jgi:hypothetical protein
MVGYTNPDLSDFSSRDDDDIREIQHKMQDVLQLIAERDDLRAMFAQLQRHLEFLKEV